MGKSHAALTHPGPMRWQVTIAGRELQQFFQNRAGQISFAQLHRLLEHATLVSHLAIRQCMVNGVFRGSPDGMFTAATQ